MCKKINNKKCPNTKIDKCMLNLIKMLNIALCEDQHTVVACCCGHGKYPMTLIIKEEIYINGKHAGFKIREWFSDVLIPRKKKFYKRDKQGHYYIPEVKKS